MGKPMLLWVQFDKIPDVVVQSVMVNMMNEIITVELHVEVVAENTFDCC